MGGLIRYRCSLWWIHHVPWNCRKNEQRTCCTCSIHNENQNHCSSRKKILCMDWWIFKKWKSSGRASRILSQAFHQPVLHFCLTTFFDEKPFCHDFHPLVKNEDSSWDLKDE